MFIKKYPLSNYLDFFTFIILLITGFLTYKDYGIGIDDKFHRLNGFYWLNYLLSFTNFEDLKKIVEIKLLSFSDFTLPSIEYYNSYSIIFDVPAALLEIFFNKNTPKDFYEFKHLLNFLFFYIGCYFFYLILNKRFNRFISLAGTILFILSPRIYGESFYNMKDIIYLTFMSAAYYFCLKSFLSMNFRNMFFLALFSGLCIQLRIFGLLIPLSFISFYLLSILARSKDIKEVNKIIFFVVLTISLTYVLWPYLWENPLISFLKIFQNIIPNVYILFNGSYINNEYLPYSYLPLWIFITTPVMHLILFFLGTYFILKRFFKRLINIEEKSITYDLWKGKKEKFDSFLLLNFILLFGLVILLNLKLINAWKHLYFFNFFIVYFGVFYINIIYIKYFKSKNFKYLIIFFSIMLIFISYRMIYYHPYQGLYFNFLVSDKFKNKFDRDFTALSARNFFDKILLIEKDTKLIKIANASWTPLHRTLEIYRKDEREKIKLVNQNYKDANYIYTNHISEVDKTVNDKYNIPTNFRKFYDFTVDGIVIYSVYKRGKN